MTEKEQNKLVDTIIHNIISEAKLCSYILYGDEQKEKYDKLLNKWLNNAKRRKKKRKI